MGVSGCYKYPKTLLLSPLQSKKTKVLLVKLFTHFFLFNSVTFFHESFTFFLFKYELPITNLSSKWYVISSINYSRFTFCVNSYSSHAPCFLFWIRVSTLICDFIDHLAPHPTVASTPTLYQKPGISTLSNFLLQFNITNGQDCCYFIYIT